MKIKAGDLCTTRSCTYAVYRIMSTDGDIFKITQVYPHYPNQITWMVRESHILPLTQQRAKKIKEYLAIRSLANG